MALAGQKYLNHNNHMTEAFEEAEAARYIEKLEASGTGDLDVLQWNMSRRSAEKSVTSFAKYHTDVRIVPTTVPHVTQPREKAAA